MKEKIFNNFNLKILSAICAIILWMTIVNIYDPAKGFWVTNISVQIINENALKDKGYTYEIVDGNKISVYVSGPKSIVTDIKSSDIYATADLSKITSSESYVDIDVKVIKDGKEITNVEVTPKTTSVKLNIENRETKSFDINYETKGELTDGYVVTSQAISPTTLKVTGPTSLIDKIANVKASVNISDLSNDTQDTVPIGLYDEDGNELDISNVEMSIQEISYTATIRPSKSVPIKYSVGQAPNGYKVTNAVVSPANVVIAGEKSVIDSINEIVIPSNAVNLSNTIVDTNFKLLVSNYLPQNVKLISDNYITLKLSVSDYLEKTISIPSENIEIRNLPNTMTANVVPDSIKITLEGKKNAVESLTEANIKPYIDVAGMTLGDNTVKISFDTLPASVSTEVEDNVVVRLSKKEEATSTNP